MRYSLLYNNTGTRSSEQSGGIREAIYNLNIDRMIGSACKSAANTDYFLSVLAKPLTDTDAISYRQAIIRDLINMPDLLDGLTDAFKGYDNLKAETEEMTGGEFSAARYIVSVDGRLIFGTGTGVISIFNSDKKGLAPDGKGEDEAPPKSGLHPYYYSFDHHAPRYALKTAKDSCGMPHLSKSTVKHSLAMKLKSAGSGSFTAEVFCDTRGYRELCDFPSGKLSFSDMDFSSLTLETEDSYTVPLSEREKRWVEKQIAVYTDEYESPFGVYSIAYRFTVEGKIKKNR